MNGGQGSIDNGHAPRNHRLGLVLTLCWPLCSAEEETAAREAVLAESQAVLAQMEAQNRDVLAALKAATEEAAAARRALAAAQEEGRKRDALVLKNQQLESARHFDRVAQASGVGAATQRSSKAPHTP